MLSYGELVENAERMRQNPTKSEKAFAKRMRRARIPFLPQQIIAFYIADFVLPDKMIVVEVDGKSHRDRAAYDAHRDATLKSFGFRVIRIPVKHVSTFQIEELIDQKEQPAHVYADALEKATQAYWRHVDKVNPVVPLEALPPKPVRLPKVIKNYLGRIG